MKTKTFVVAGIIGGIVDFVLGWLFYGLIFANFFPKTDESTKSMVFILLGCLTFGLFLSYIFNRWAQISTAATGLKAGAIIGIFMGLITNFFKMAMQSNMSYERFGIDILISILLAAGVGAAIGFINGKMA